MPPADKPVVRTTCAVASALLALALAACGKEPPPPPKKAAEIVLPVEPPPQVTSVPDKPVEPPRASADKALADKVKSALLSERGLNAHGIDVVAKNGVVTLYGTAETPARRETAAKVAGNVAGVKAVENKLAVVAGS